MSQTMPTTNLVKSCDVLPATAIREQFLMVICAYVRLPLAASTELKPFILTPRPTTPMSLRHLDELASCPPPPPTPSSSQGEVAPNSAKSSVRQGQGLGQESWPRSRVRVSTGLTVGYAHCILAWCLLLRIGFCSTYFWSSNIQEFFNDRTQCFWGIMLMLHFLLVW